MQTDAINPALIRRLELKRQGKYKSPIDLCYSSRWGGKVFRVGENVGYRSTFGRWHEFPETPFRFIGLAHKIVRLNYTGWYTQHDNYDETARGVVYMLPHGKFIAAIADECNAGTDGRGPCIVEVKENGTPFFYDSKEEAARNADSFAERYAESAREFDRIESERQRLEDEMSEVEQELDEKRAEARGLVSDIRESKLSPGLCERMKHELRAIRAAMHRAVRTINQNKTKLATL